MDDSPPDTDRTARAEPDFRSDGSVYPVQSPDRRWPRLHVEREEEKHARSSRREQHVLESLCPCWVKALVTVQSAVICFRLAVIE